MKKRKVLYIVTIFLLFITLNRSIVLAEVGNTGGFGGGSSSDSSSWSSDYSSDGGGSGSVSVEMIIIIIVGSIIVSAILPKTKGKRSAFNLDYIDESSVVSKIHKNDPNFSISIFNAYVGEVYMSLQRAWQRKDWNAVRPFESNSLYNMHFQQLQEYVELHKTNFLEHQDVRSVSIADYYITGNIETIVVRLNACLVDYTLDDNTGKLLDGNKTVLQERSYRLEFIRTLGTLTSSSKEVHVVNCPNCGAPASVTSSTVCEYCHSIITSKEFSWVLNSYKAWK